MSGQKTYIDCDELAVRIAEACMSSKRPEGLSGTEAIRQLTELSPDVAKGFQRASLAAAKYIAECVNAEHPGRVEVAEMVIQDSKGVPS